MPDVVLSLSTWNSFLSGWGECQGMTARQPGHACSSAVSPPMTDSMGMAGTGAGAGGPGAGTRGDFFFSPLPALPRSRLRLLTFQGTVVLRGLRATPLAAAS